MTPTPDGAPVDPRAIQPAAECAPKHGRCALPLIDFESGTDRILICGDGEHPAPVCALAELRAKGDLSV
jgi:hypothetical protein